MIHTITFDTSQCTEELLSGGFSKDQAKTQTRLMKNQTDEFDRLLATKHDIKIIEERIVNSEKNTNKWGWMIMLAIALLGILSCFGVV
jgi:predicted phage-related endonuclease